MTTDQIRSAIHQSISRITGISPADIHDSSKYVDDLGLDSLSMLELTVDLEYAFKIKVPEDRLRTLQTVSDTIQLVQEYLPATT
jgi:acyl carrier protein